MQKPSAILWILLSLSLAGCGGGGGGAAAATYTVGGTVTGVTLNPNFPLVLQNNGGDDLAVPALGTFTFKTKLAAGAGYYVRISKNPGGAFILCVVTNGTGRMGNGNVTNVSVVCKSILDKVSACAPQSADATSAGSAEGIWWGSFQIPFVSDISVPVRVEGIVTAEGQAYFSAGSNTGFPLVFSDTVWTGTVMAASGGATSSILTRYVRAAFPGLGGPKNPGQGLAFHTATAFTTLSGGVGTAASCHSLNLGYQDPYKRAASLAVLAGVYTKSDGNGYTLTVTIHGDGQLDGSDTSGCVLLGSVTVPDPAKNQYNAVADASSCGTLSGHYSGVMYLTDGATANDNAGLNLFLTNPDAAIFDKLFR